MWFGWKTLNIDDSGYPTEKDTAWVASCFIIYRYIIYVGKPRYVG